MVTFVAAQDPDLLGLYPTVIWMDQASAFKHLRFTIKIHNVHSRRWTQAEVDMRGWTNQTIAAGKDQWIKGFSDHSLLYLEVQRI